MGLVSENQVGAFSSPANGQDGDASVVLSNDNTLRQAGNAHDADATIHVQSSTLASRPAAGTAERFWVTTDGLRAYIDDGASWDELDYLCKAAGGTVAGATTFSGGLTVSAGTTAVQALTATTGTFSGNISFTGSAGKIISEPTNGLTFTAGGSDRVIFGVSGQVLVGTTITTSASAGEVVLANAKALRGVNAAGNDTLPIAQVDSNNHIQLGNLTSQFVRISSIASGSLAAGAAGLNGSLVVDSTNNRLVFYSGGNRYYIAGTSF